MTRWRCDTIGRTVISLAFLLAVAAAPPLRPQETIYTALLRDPDVASCADESGENEGVYVAGAFRLRQVRLQHGERMTIALAGDACLMRGQSARVMIYEQTQAGFRRVLDSVTFEDSVEMSSDGTVVLPTHDTIATILESAYVWNGDVFVFSPALSHLYDVALSERRPYQIPLRMTNGTYAGTLSGTVAENFGDDYSFTARAGQTVTLELTSYDPRRPVVLLTIGDRTIADVAGSQRWSGKLPASGSYVLMVYGEGDPDATELSKYAIRLSVH